MDMNAYLPNHILRIKIYSDPHTVLIATQSFGSYEFCDWEKTMKNNNINGIIFQKIKDLELKYKEEDELNDLNHERNE